MIKFKHLFFCLLPLMGCTHDAEEQTMTENLASITMSAKDFEYDNDKNSRTSLDITPGGASFSWAANDTVGIFPNEGAQAYFPMIEGAGTKCASFTGGGWALKSSAEYAAYYPFIKSMDFDKTAIPVSYVGQTQVGNASTAHLGKYDYMAAVATTPEQGQVNFDFKHLGALVELNFILPKGIYFMAKIACNENVLVTQGSVDLTSPTLDITPKITSNSLDIKLDKLQVSTEQAQVKVYLMCAPVDLTGKTIRVALNTGGSWKRFKLAGGNWLAGKAYAVTPVVEEGLDQSNWVDLGLPSGLLWASCNVGANTPQEYGDYFAWGETTPKESYDKNCLTDGKPMADISGNPQYDAATAKWGAPARMPKKEEFEELSKYCTTTWVVGKGYSVLGPNGNSIFLPAAGCRRETSLDLAGKYGYYWSSTPDKRYDGRYISYYLDFDSGNFFWDASRNRYYGHSVRPVRN